MEAAYKEFARRDLDVDDRAELDRVESLAGLLRDHLTASAAAIEAVHIHRASSSAVQAIVAAMLTDQLGFEEERVLTPEAGFMTSARPDFVFRLAPGRGVLAEVERGGTTTNNHDLKDLWKTHIASDAQHLFLIVPLANWNAAGVARERPFQRVSRRLAGFFGDPRREVDVMSLHLFGYGGATLLAQG